MGCERPSRHREREEAAYSCFLPAMQKESKDAREGGVGKVARLFHSEARVVMGERKVLWEV